MLPSGTPVVALPAYVAPAFTAPSVSLRGAITFVTLESRSTERQTNIPFKFGQVFWPGALAPGDGLAGLIGDAIVPLQMNVKATHADGSVRHAVITGVLPILGGKENLKMTLYREAPDTSTTAPLIDLSETYIALVDGGIVYRADHAQVVYQEIIGPIASGVIMEVPFRGLEGNKHPHLTAVFDIMTFASGATRADMTIEHTDSWAENDVDYTVTMVTGETTHTETVHHFPGARFHRVLWRGAAPKLHIGRDLNYLRDSRAVPNVRCEKIDEAYLAGLNTTFTPMKPGRFTANMETTGGRPEIGLLTDCQAAYLVCGDVRAWDAMIAGADHAGSWSIHRRDRSGGPADGQPMDVIHWPRATIKGNPGDSVNRLTGKNEKLYSYTNNPKAISSIYPYNRYTTSTLVADDSHEPAFAYLPYLLTGDYYYLEEMHFWMHYNQYNLNCAYRAYEKGWFKPTQVRGQAWSLRTLFQSAYITPDAHPAKAAMLYWVDTNAEYYRSTYVEGPENNNLGILTKGFGITYDNHLEMPPWMDHFFTSAIGVGVELLDNPKLKALLDWKARFPVGLMTDPEYCWTDATVYTLQVRNDWYVLGADGKVMLDANREPIEVPVFKTFGECYRATFPDKYLVGACGSLERLAYDNKARAIPLKLGEMTGYAYSNTGYPANMQPALAYAVDAGAPGAKEAWARFESRTVKPTYADGPQFAVVPRVPVVIAPPVVVPPPVVTTPPPPPPPAPTPLLGSAVVLSGTMTIKHPALIGKKGLNVHVYILANKSTILTSSNRTPTSTGLISITSKYLIGGVNYGAWVSDATGSIIAGMKP